MTQVETGHRTLAPVRRLAILVAAFALSLLSCGREITGPHNAVVRRVAHGLSFIAEFPGPLASVAQGAGSVVPFERVRVLFLRLDGQPALDTIVAFPAQSQELALSLSVALSDNAPPSGEQLDLFLRYINAAGDTVFRGGPVPVLAVPAGARGGTPAPAAVPLVYTGPGASATTVTAAPDTAWIVSGDTFAFAATTRDAADSLITDAPVVWTSLDPQRATITAMHTGAGVSLPSRGPARVRVQLAAGGGADTVMLMIAPRAGSLALVAGGAQTAPINAPLADSIRVRVNGTDGLPMAGVTVAFATATDNGTVSADTVVSDTLGIAAVQWTLGTAVGTQTLTATATGVPALVVSASSEATGPASLAITQQPPTGLVAGDTLTAVIVEVRNTVGAVATEFTDSITIAIAAGPAGATLEGRTRVAAVAGIATFDSLRLTRRGVYTLGVSASGLAGATSTPITVATAAATTLLVESGAGQSGALGSTLPLPIVARVIDDFGNGVSGINLTFSADSGGSLTPSAAVTDTAGRASAIWTLGNASGPQHATISSDNPALDPVVIAANDGTGPIVTTDVTPSADTLVSIGETRTLIAQSRDLALNLVSGTYTWTSRTPAVATVDANGTVTAVTNGSAWIIALETGGTSDSAQVVVQQQLSSVTVTPGNRDIYLGAGFDFSAQAVDGLGVPMLTQPQFTWSVVSSAIAAVDTAGYVTGVGLGSTQVRATANSIVGVATVTVRTPITRIAVVRDSIGFVATDTFTIVALQRTRSYRAVAYDTLDVVMTGIAFTWESANPSVALLDSTGTETARARAEANGVTAIRARAQGVTGAASLRVQQVLSSIALTPATATIAPTGSTLLTARGLDPDGFYLPSISGVAFSSTNPAVATVNATSGLVTGVANGSAIIRGTRDSLTSNDVTITVGGDVPAVISFGRDTLAIGRSANTSIPVYLSRPHTGPVTVNLAVEDTIAYFSTATITIPAGSTSGNATLNGRNAGTTRLFATDGSASGYAGDTASLSVQANVRFSTTSYAILATNSVSTQVLLSDPAPAGGAFITYAYGTPGRVEISPDPVFIPAGQLSANIVLTGVTAGTTTITPVATGVNGQVANVTVSAAILEIPQTSILMGLGQYRTDPYVYVPTNTLQPIPVALSATDSTVVGVGPTATIPANLYYAYFNVLSRALGATHVRATAAGFTSDSMLVRVTTPRVTMCCGGTRTTTSGPATLTVYSADSTAAGHNRIAPLVVSLTSRDTTIARLLSTTATIQANTYYVSTAQFAPGGEIGSTYIVASAAGHRPDSVLVTMNGPKLQFSFTIDNVGVGQRLDPYVYLPDNTPVARTVFLTSSDPGIVAVPDSVIIPAGTYYAYFTARGEGLGLGTLFASTAGHEPDTATVRVTTPRITLSGGGSFNNFAPPAALTTYATDSLGTGRNRLTPLVVTYTSSDTTVVRVTAADTIAAGIYYTSNARVTFVGEGTAQVTASADGHVGASVTYTVTTPRIRFNTTTYRIGRRQYRNPTDFYVYTPHNRADTLPVTITQLHPDRVSLSSTQLDIPTGTYYRYFGLSALEFGADTIVVSAPGYLPDTMVVTVTTPRLNAGGLPGTATTTSPPGTVTVYTADSLNTAHYSLDTLVITAASTDSTVIQPLQPSYRVLPGQYFVNTQHAYVGPGTARMFYLDSAATGYRPDTTDNAVTVTGPSLSLVNSRPRLGMRQNGAMTSSYVQVPNNITGNPLVVRLLSTDPSVASVPDSVVIPVGTYYAYFQITAHDVVGTVQIQATAPGYSPATVNQEVTAPRFVLTVPTSLRTTSPAAAVYVGAADASGTQHYVNENVVVTLASSNTAAGTIDSTTVTIPAGGYFSNTARFAPQSAGSTQISASDARTESYRYGEATATISVTTPPLVTSWGTSPLSIGVNQWREDAYVSVNDNRTSPLILNLAHATGASVTADTLTIPTGTYYRYVRVTGAAVGVDTISFTAPGHTAVAGPVSVGLGRVDGITGWPTTLSTDSVQVTLNTRDPAGTARNVSTATTFTLSANANVEFRSGGAVITAVTVPANTSTATFWVRRTGAGTASVSITSPNYQTYNSTITVNSP